MLLCKLRAQSFYYGLLLSLYAERLGIRTVCVIPVSLCLAAAEHRLLAHLQFLQELRRSTAFQNHLPSPRIPGHRRSDGGAAQDRQELGIGDRFAMLEQFPSQYCNCTSSCLCSRVCSVAGHHPAVR